MIALDWHVIAGLTMHPIQAAVLETLADGPMSPVEFQRTRRKDASLGTVSYHFRRLARLNLIDVGDTIQRRGAVEHRYVLTALACAQPATDHPEDVGP